MKRFLPCFVGVILTSVALPLLSQGDKPKLYTEPLNVKIPSITTDKSVKYDFNIVYVRAKRAGDTVHKRFYTDFSQPVTISRDGPLP